MKTDEIIFIKTDKEGSNLREIQEDYPNSIIDVNSQKEKNIYIGSERVTDNYNIGVDENSITNNVGGMTSGINASELKGKSISEILDTILFASNNNMTLKGVQVVDKIDNLTDNTLTEIYQGMVVSVVEDNSLYILLTNPDDSDSDIEWKKVGVDADIEELKVSTKKLSAPIVVAGLSESIGNITNGMEFGTDKTIEDILRELLCKEIYPSVSLTTVNSTLSFGGMTIDTTNDNYESIMEVGSILNLGSVTLSSASISDGYRVGKGFDWGYSNNNDSNKDGNGNPPKIYTNNKKLVGNYSLMETYSPETIGNIRTISPSEKCEDVKFDASTVEIALGSNQITISALSPSGLYTHPEYPEYYVISNLGKTDKDKKLSKSNKLDRTLDSVSDIYEISVNGVYPFYVNIDSGRFVNDTKKMNLTTENVFTFVNIPSESESGIHFKFDYPSTHVVTSFEIEDLKGNFVKFDGDYDVDLVIPDKNICEKNVSYKRLQTKGGFQGNGLTYRITLSDALNE